MKALEETAALTTSLEQAMKVAGELKKERWSDKQELSKLCEGKECFEYEGPGPQAKLQFGKLERDKYVHAVNREQSGDGELQVLVAKVSSGCRSI